MRNSLPEDSFSFDEASPTVQDAVRVVRNLGRRYLWVDKYCINQNEKAEQQMMLRNMDLIYEHAEVTIVAMSGENDEAGLPGVCGRARTPQPQFRTTRGYLISSCPTISQLFQTSKWATRGWTHQEARLSRRCLFLRSTRFISFVWRLPEANLFLRVRKVAGLLHYLILAV